MAALTFNHVIPRSLRSVKWQLIMIAADKVIREIEQDQTLGARKVVSLEWDDDQVD
jgi:hypothetical protein